MKKRSNNRWQQLRDEALRTFEEFAPRDYEQCRWCREAEEQAAEEARSAEALVSEVEAYLKQQAAE